MAKNPKFCNSEMPSVSTEPSESPTAFPPSKSGGEKTDVTPAPDNGTDGFKLPSYAKDYSDAPSDVPSEAPSGTPGGGASPTKKRLQMASKRATRFSLDDLRIGGMSAKSCFLAVLAM